MIPHSRPTISEHEIEEVISCLRSGQISAGEKVKKLERRAAEYLSLPEAVAVSSGTSALHLSLLALKIEKNAEVIIPSYVCAALLNAINYIGAKPVLADLDEDSPNCSIQSILNLVNRKTAAIIYPHMFGFPSGITPLFETGVPVIEDIAVSIGAAIDDKKVGTSGICSVASFYSTKMLAGGEGGMIITSDKKLSEEIRDLNRYDHRSHYRVRYNYKMTDLQAALIIVQFRNLDKFIETRRRLAADYIASLKGLPVRFPKVSNNEYPVYYRFPVILEKEAAPVIDRMKAAGVMAELPLFKPIHVYLDKKGYPNTEHFWRHTISLPLYPSLTGEERNIVIDTFKKALK